MNNGNFLGSSWKADSILESAKTNFFEIWNQKT